VENAKFDANITHARKYLLANYGDIKLPKTSYLVTMTARSGSSLLCMGLEKIGFGHPVEAFNVNKNPMFENNWDIDFNDSHAYIKKAIEFQTVNGVFGMKLNWKHLKLFVKHARKLLEGSGIVLSDAQVVEVFFKNVRHIHLRRREKVKQAISYEKAWQNGIWVEKADADEEYKSFLLPTVYDREHIECCLDILLMTEAEWYAYFIENRIDCLMVWYEDLAADYVTTMQTIYGFLGIKGQSISAPPLKKLANVVSDDWNARFRRETPWLIEINMDAKAADDDDYAVWLERGKLINKQRQWARWKKMPATRLKSIRTLVFRVERKVKRLFGKAE
jgi:trehalose 2-sulfotransferase